MNAVWLQKEDCPEISELYEQADTERDALVRARQGTKRPSSKDTRPAEGPRHGSSLRVGFAEGPLSGRPSSGLRARDAGPSVHRLAGLLTPWVLPALPAGGGAGPA